MEELIISPYLLAALFGFVSAVYSSVGLGGGSSYTALLSIFQASHRVIPGISLSLNLVVTLIGSVNFARKGHLRARLVVPLLLTSMPAAYLGGLLPLSARAFQWILLGTLLVVAARIYFWRDRKLDRDLGQRAKIIIALLLGGSLGLISGIVGIGGGIYLVPLILFFGLGDEKEAAAAGAIFITLNSLSGLLAHLQRGMPDFMLMLPLLGAVFVGSALGSYFGAARFGASTIRRVLGVVILVAITLLAFRLLR